MITQATHPNWFCHPDSINRVHTITADAARRVIEPGQRFRSEH
jgi:hypothetical protein